MSLFELLINNQIPYERFDHVALFTCQDSDALAPDMPGAPTKNLFLRDGKGKKHFVVTISHSKRIDLKRLAQLLEVDRLSFASSERLKNYLGLEPGSVTLLAIVNDIDRQVEFIIDKELWQENSLQCHPLVNTATLVISRENILRLFEIVKRELRVIDLPNG